MLRRRIAGFALTAQLLSAVMVIAFVAIHLPSTARADEKKKKKKGKKKGESEAPSPEAKSSPLGQAAEQQKSPDQERLDAAVRQFKEEQYAQSAVAFHEIVKSDAPEEVRTNAEYNLAKALYRIGLHHAALQYFNNLLAKGPDSTHYRSVLEWCLFISRRIVGDDRVLAQVARNSDGNFPEEYKDEYRYQLARYHYLEGLGIESGAAGALGATKAEATVTGGVSMKGDIFGDEGGEEPDKDAKKEKEDEPEVQRKGQGFSVAEDIFGDKPEEEPKKEDAPKKEEPAKAADKPKSGGDLTSKEHFEAAGRFILQVDQASKWAAKAKFLEGVLAYKGERDADAVLAFQSVVRMTKPGGEAEDEDLRQLAFFQLARTHFGAKQPTSSIFYYDKVERFTYAWLRAIYESSWAEFRLAAFEKVLGNLLTLHSPFFEDQYFPESHILKAVTYYENCRYPEALDILAGFLKRYEPVLAELNAQTERTQSADKFYEVLNNLRTGDIAGNDATKSKILSQILEIALSDADLKQLDAAFREVDTEMKGYADQGAVFASSKLREELESSVGEVRGELEKEAGRAVKRKLERERDAIKELIAQAIRIQVETSRAEQEREEGKLVGGESAPPARAKDFVDWADDEKVVWSFEDEYWRDELGTYQLTLAHSCR